MGRLDDLLDEVLEKAKVAADVAGRKTNEMVELGKLKYKAKQLSWDIEKTYAKLGALVYETQKSGDRFDEVTSLVIDELDGLNARLDRLEAKIAGYRTSSSGTVDVDIDDFDDMDAPEEVFDEPTDRDDI